MDSSHRERLKDIQRRKEEREKEARRKRILFNRCIIVLAGLAIIFLIVFGIKSCVSSIAQRNAEKAAEEQAITEAETELQEPQNLISTEGSIDQSFYANSAFIGNSFVDGMEIYELIDDADYFARIGLSVQDAMTVSTATGSTSVIDELNGEKKYDKIFFMFGENELGWLNMDTFKTSYTVLIEKARQYQPSAEIYLLAVTPVTAEISAKGENGTTNENVVKFNKIILEIARAENVNFIDIYSAVVNDEGCLPDEAASDGIHFTESYYKKCLVYIQNAFKN